MSGAEDAALRDASADAVLICHLLAVDPVGLGGVALVGSPGPGRDAFLTCFKSLIGSTKPFVTVPLMFLQIALKVALISRQRLLPESRSPHKG